MPRLIIWKCDKCGRTQETNALSLPEDWAKATFEIESRDMTFEKIWCTLCRDNIVRPNPEVAYT